MLDVLQEIGIDIDDLEVHDLALCKGMDLNMFYDSYEFDRQVAANTDQVCLSCPIMAQCLAEGMENNLWGVWGGIYLTNGKVDKKKNAHKTPEVWAMIKERLGGLPTDR